MRALVYTFIAISMASILYSLAVVAKTGSGLGWVWLFLSVVVLVILTKLLPYDSWLRTQMRKLWSKF
jgi:hypothetical protein